MANIHETFWTDPKLEDDGAWITHPSGAEFKIAYVKGPRFAQAVAKHQMDLAANNGVLTEDERVRFTVKCMAEGVLLDWRKVEDAKGKTVRYSAKKAEEYLYTYRELRRWIDQQSDTISNFRGKVDAHDDETLGN